MKRSYIPVVSFVNHQDVVSDVMWEKVCHALRKTKKKNVFFDFRRFSVQGSAYKILTAGKDGMICKQSVNNSFKSFEHIRTTGLAWSPQVQLTTKISFHPNILFLFFTY